MNQDTQLFLSDAEHQLINTLLDQLIPASNDGHIPAAGVLGVTNFLCEMAQSDPRFASMLRSGTEKACGLVKHIGDDLAQLTSEQKIGLLKQLEREDPAFFDLLLRYTYMGYYSRSDIRPLLGLSSEPTQPRGYQVPIESPGEMAALTRAVKNRGPCFRAC